MEYLINGAERTIKIKLEPTSYHSKIKLLINEIINVLEKYQMWDCTHAKQVLSTELHPCATSLSFYTK
jgi:hypothetical protein